MNYRTINDLNTLILNNLYKIPKNIDLIVGIPRSGLMVANILALYLNKKISTPELFSNNIIISNGISRPIDNNEIKTVLVVDDSCNTGKSMLTFKNNINNTDVNYIYLAAYTTNSGKRFLDIFLETLEQPRIFQWNIMNSWLNINAVYDIDGVLCENPKIDDDGELYINEIKNASPKFITKYRIGTVCTCRLEKYRSITEEWLREHNVSYDKLVMMQYSTKEERVKANCHGQFKGEIFANSSSNIFFESDYNQANTIKQMNPGKQVFCVDKMIFV